MTTNSNPYFSVVIPTYNTGKLIERTLDSLVQQTFKNFEVIISDDGSPDPETLRIVESYATKLSLKILRNPNWGGPAKPRNLAILAASAPWIAFLDHDDWWCPEKLQTVYSLTADFDILYHDLTIHTPTGPSKRKIRGRSLGNNAFENLMIGGNALANSSVVVKKSVLQSVNLFSEDKNLIAVEDFDLWLRIAQAGFKFRYINQLLGSYWLATGTTLTARNEKQLRAYQDVYERHFNKLTPFALYKSKAILSYTKARIYHSLNKLSQAKREYRTAINAKPTQIKIKAVIGWFLVSAKF